MEVEEKKDSPVAAFFDIVITFVVVCAIFVVLRYFIRFPIVNGESMIPTYHGGERLVVLYTKDVDRNDVIVSWSGTLDEYIVKRVIGVPGDKIDIRDGVLYRNGVMIYESYINDMDWNSGEDISVIVDEDQYFLLGDNRDHSTDSREIGTVSRSDIFGKVLLILSEKQNDLEG